MKIVELTEQQSERGGQTLFSAFDQDPLVLWMFDGLSNYQKKALWAFTTWVKWAAIYGQALATQGYESVLLLKKPGKLDFSFMSLWRSGMHAAPRFLGEVIFEKLRLYDQLSKAEQVKNMGLRAFWYWWLIGTEPQHRGLGYGKLLLNKASLIAQPTKSPCYLETASESNRKIYEQLGFKVVSSFALPNADFKVYCMIN